MLIAQIIVSLLALVVLLVKIQQQLVDQLVLLAMHMMDFVKQFVLIIYMDKIMYVYQIVVLVMLLITTICVLVIVRMEHSNKEGTVKLLVLVEHMLILKQTLVQELVHQELTAIPILILAFQCAL